MSAGGSQAPSGIAPEMFDAKFECLVIGVRNMEAFNLMDIGNPIVEMDSGDCKPCDSQCRDCERVRQWVSGTNNSETMRQ